MSNPNIKPIKVDVKAGETKAFCMCGKSQNFPSCDGCHKGTSFVPKIEKFTEDKTVYICRCGKSSNLPYCDGTHAKL